MPFKSARDNLTAGLFATALVLGAVGAWGPGDEDVANTLFFAAWCAALLLVFVLALRLPLQSRRKGYRVALETTALVAAALGVTLLANAALFRHDVHFDLSRSSRFTPPAALDSVATSLTRDVAVSYFYNDGDDEARKAKDLLGIVARRSPRFHFRAFDLDKQPAAAREEGIRAYNTALIQVEGRRLQVENTTDLNQIAFAVIKVLRQRSDTLCLAAGHGEPLGAPQSHVHFSHVETLDEHNNPGSGDVLEAPADGLDRLKLSLEAIGYELKQITPALLSAIPEDCTVLADIGPRLAYAPEEARLLADYLGRGGRVLLMLDPTFPVEPSFAELLARLGVATEAAVVVDPVNHYRAEEDKVAIPYYPPHPITEHLALTFFPGARPVRLLTPPAGITATELFASSHESYLRPLDAPPTSAAPPERAPATLAVALEGSWPPDAAPHKPFRLVLVGNSHFATNAYFPYVSNGELAVSIIRWLAADTATPAVKPESYSLAQITLTHREMQGIFVVTEILLPLGVILIGALVWWVRR